MIKFRNNLIQVNKKIPEIMEMLEKLDDVDF